MHDRQLRKERCFHILKTNKLNIGTFRHEKFALPYRPFVRRQSVTGEISSQRTSDIDSLIHVLLVVGCWLGQEQTMGLSQI